MNAVPIAILVDGLITALLLITIGFCLGLYRRLGMLRLEEHRLRATMADLAAASRRAEGAIAGLRGLADETEGKLKSGSEHAAQLVEDLERRTVTARAVLTRIVAISRAVRPDPPRFAVPRRASEDEGKAA